MPQRPFSRDQVFLIPPPLDVVMDLIVPPGAVHAQQEQCTLPLNWTVTEFD